LTLVRCGDARARQTIQKGNWQKLVNFLNDLLAFYLIRVHWDLITQQWLRDPLKFPDLNHAVKRDPRTNLRSAKNNWDFWTSLPEALHQVTITMSDRGMAESCGSVASVAADPDGCDGQYIHMLDDRYEVRDAQYFAGELVDEGWVDPAKIAATGGSYGGGMSMALAALKDRTMLPNGFLVPWKSPAGTPISLAVATPLVPWTDLAYSLSPNGRVLDYLRENPYDPEHIGIMKSSIINGLYLSGNAIGRYAPVGTYPQADMTGWRLMMDQGEPHQNHLGQSQDSHFS